MMYPSVSLLFDLEGPVKFRRVYDSPTFISTEPRLRRLGALAGYLASALLPGEPRRRRQAAISC